jgi:benzoyl-CoA reductase/2-hydroxyglutaryl-CoA dehydratase subunit BcrC/BadD/HgdB
MNSCDAMRRLADAWARVRPNDNIILLDLPVTVDDAAVAYFTGELSRLNDALSEWCGHTITHRRIAASIVRYNKLPPLLSRLRERLRQNKLSGGSTRMQRLYNAAMSLSFDKSRVELERALAEPQSEDPVQDGIPVYLFGNVLADPEALELFESCSARIIEDDLCTGSRLFAPIEFDERQDGLPQISSSLLSRPPCARTFDPAQPLKLAQDILARAQASGARGVIGQTIKFCDPYLDRLPAVRQALRRAGIPLLLLEGDCSLRTIEQQRTRIEAFIEMLD